MWLWREKFPAPTGTRTHDHPARSPALYYWAIPAPHSPGRLIQSLHVLSRPFHPADWRGSNNWEVPGSNLRRVSSYVDWDSSWFISASPVESRFNIFKQIITISSQILIHYPSPSSHLVRCYVNFAVERANLRINLPFHKPRPHFPTLDLSRTGRYINAEESNL
jgi:hypothetical protein